MLIASVFTKVRIENISANEHKMETIQTTDDIEIEFNVPEDEW